MVDFSQQGQGQGQCQSVTWMRLMTDRYVEQDLPWGPKLRLMPLADLGLSKADG